MLPGIGNRIGTAAVMAALVVVSALSVPAAAFAAAPWPEDPDCAIDAGNPGCQFGAPFEAPNVPTNPDDPRCVGSPLSVGCEGGPFDEDPITSEWPRLPGEPMSHRGLYDPGRPAIAPPNDTQLLAGRTAQKMAERAGSSSDPTRWACDRRPAAWTR
jgi:hypothetical protein